MNITTNTAKSTNFQESSGYQFLEKRIKLKDQHVIDASNDHVEQGNAAASWSNLCTKINIIHFKQI